MARRIQRQRTRGWRMPEGAIYVGRPSVWGNRYQIGTHSNTLGRAVETVEEAMRLYREVLWSEPHQHAYIREQLRGRDLVCWCPLDRPCHADVLIEIANRPRRCVEIEGPYLLRTNDAWWRPNSAGYTSRLGDAGVYYGPRALRHPSFGDNCRDEAVPLADVLDQARAELAGLQRLIELAGPTA